RTLTYKLRAEVPGRFHCLPTRVEAMYAPSVNALADEARLSIVDRARETGGGGGREGGSAGGGR
ncbi:MAG: hypothetical protein HYZ53_22040, partial [Planctomycetes bacterium]|nr:hypothetical protein [Planctomycetota bacterium]